MAKRFLFLMAAALLVIQFSGSSYASWKEKAVHADKNKDGIVDRKEIHMEKKERMIRWKHERCKVNTKVEAKYDLDGNGWLNAEEVREMLRDRYAIIKTEGKAKVNTDIEAEYDTNKDGVIDAKEAESLEEDLK